MIQSAFGMDEEKHGAKINADKSKRAESEWKTFCIYLTMMPSKVLRLQMWQFLLLR